MKKYLFGLGAMLVGAGLMFVLMHGEVSADSNVERPERFICSHQARTGGLNSTTIVLRNCQTKNLDCAVSIRGDNLRELVCFKR